MPRPGWQRGIPKPVRRLRERVVFKTAENNRKTTLQADNRPVFVAKHLQVKYTTRLVLFQLKIIEWRK
jgi:hypothetical protein